MGNFNTPPCVVFSVVKGGKSSEQERHRKASRERITRNLQRLHPKTKYHLSERALIRGFQARCKTIAGLVSVL
jgi:hypothetical protein